MAIWFTGKIRFTKEVEPGKFQAINEAYLIDATSYTEAEARLYDIVGDGLPDFKVTSIVPTKVQEVFWQDEFEKWWKLQITITTYDEKTKKEKKSTSSFILGADTAKDAYSSLEDRLGRVEDYEITGISLTPICSIHPYEPDNQRFTTLNQSPTDRE